VKKFLLLSLMIVLTMQPRAFAEGAEDQKITHWLSDINHASEKGDFDTVQSLRMNLADYAADIGQYDLAAAQYELLLAGRPRRADRVRYFTRLGSVRMALQDYVRAIAAFDDALHDRPKDWDANLKRARAFAAADINQRAIESYQRCIKLKPLEVAPYEELAEVYEKQGLLGKALAYYEKALVRDPKPEIYLHMADCYVHQKNIAQAVSLLSQAKAQLPRADYDVRLGDIYQSLGDMPRASSAWEAALTADPKRDDVRLKLTLIYDQLHRRSDTDRLFKELLTSYPQSPLVHYFRALVLWERGERTASEAEALVVEQLSPTEQVAHFNDLLLSQLRKRPS
jgi:tetratricopeptide (TPR) repeat protein